MNRPVLPLVVLAVIVAAGPWDTAAGAAESLGPAAAAPDLALLRARVAEYRHRVDLLVSQDKIENLQAAYGYYFDKALWGEVSDLFAEDGSFEYGQMGVYVGRAHIARALRLLDSPGPAAGHLNVHMQLQAVIHVSQDGLSAKARWRGMVQLARPNSSGVWGEGVYENEYVRQQGVWKISKLHFYPTGFTDYDLGWARSALPMPGPSAVLPPDLPPTEVYRAYPGVYIPPFHYVHPVTGEPIRAPQPSDSLLRPVQ